MYSVRDDGDEGSVIEGRCDAVEMTMLYSEPDAAPVVHPAEYTKGAAAGVGGGGGHEVDKEDPSGGGGGGGGRAFRMLTQDEDEEASIVLSKVRSNVLRALSPHSSDSDDDNDYEEDDGGAAGGGAGGRAGRNGATDDDDASATAHLPGRLTGDPKFSDGMNTADDDDAAAAVALRRCDSPDSPVRKLWLRKLGLLRFAYATGDDGATELVVLGGDFPEGYCLYCQPSSDGVDTTTTTTAACALYGHPSGKTFATPEDFLPHLNWLIIGERRSKCPCDICSAQRTVAKHQHHPPSVAIPATIMTTQPPPDTQQQSTGTHLPSNGTNAKRKLSETGGDDDDDGGDAAGDWVGGSAKMPRRVGPSSVSVAGDAEDEKVTFTGATGQADVSARMPASPADGQGGQGDRPVDSGRDWKEDVDGSDSDESESEDEDYEGSSPEADDDWASEPTGNGKRTRPAFSAENDSDDDAEGDLMFDPSSDMPLSSHKRLKIFPDGESKSLDPTLLRSTPGFRSGELAWFHTSELELKTRDLEVPHIWPALVVENGVQHLRNDPTTSTTPTVPTSTIIPLPLPSLSEIQYFAQMGPDDGPPPSVGHIDRLRTPGHYTVPRHPLPTYPVTILSHENVDGILEYLDTDGGEEGIKLPIPLQLLPYLSRQTPIMTPLKRRFNRALIQAVNAATSYEVLELVGGDGRPDPAVEGSTSVFPPGEEELYVAAIRWGGDIVRVGDLVHLSTLTENVIPTTEDLREEGTTLITRSTTTSTAAVFQQEERVVAVASGEDADDADPPCVSTLSNVASVGVITTSELVTATTAGMTSLGSSLASSNGGNFLFDETGVVAAPVAAGGDGGAIENATFHPRRRVRRLMHIHHIIQISRGRIEIEGDLYHLPVSTSTTSASLKAAAVDPSEAGPTVTPEFVGVARYRASRALVGRWRGEDVVRFGLDEGDVVTECKGVWNGWVVATTTPGGSSSSSEGRMGPLAESLARLRLARLAFADDEQQDDVESEDYSDEVADDEEADDDDVDDDEEEAEVAAAAAAAAATIGKVDGLDLVYGDMSSAAVLPPDIVFSHEDYYDTGDLIRPPASANEEGLGAGFSFEGLSGPPLAEIALPPTVTDFESSHMDLE